MLCSWLSLLVLGWASGCAQPTEPARTAPSPGDAAPSLRPPPAERSSAQPGELTGQLAEPAIPLMGGGLEVRDDGLVVVADPDHDVLVLYNHRPGLPPPYGNGGERVEVLPLETGDVPNRLHMVDSDLYVVLRGAGAVARIDTRVPAVELARAPVCDQPRGVVGDEERLWVSCAGGELVTLSRDLTVLGRWFVAPDLRDLVIDADGQLWASRFVAAEVLLLDPEVRAIEARWTPDLVGWKPNTGWRMTGDHPDGGVILLHQAAVDGEVDTTASRPYYGGSDPVVVGRATWFTAAGQAWTVQLAHGDLPVDLAVVPDDDGDAMCIARAGSTSPAVFLQRPGETTGGPSGDCEWATEVWSTGRVVGVGFREGEVVMATRQPLRIQVGGPFADVIELPDLEEPRVHDLGWSLFHHAPAASEMACASCHPEGQHDGIAWEFTSVGVRRTPMVAGRVTDRAPYHWQADLPDLETLVAEVFTRRMGGNELLSVQIDDLREWVQRIRPDRALPSGDVSRGEQVFAQAGCDGCHRGAALTDNQLYDVGTGGVFKTPSLLGVGMRGPWMHDGCAETLLQRLTDESCGGGDRHGSTSGLDDAERSALVGYLETL